jgi:hypothetical protein
MIPPIYDTAWVRLVSGEKQLTTTNVGVNMLLFNSTLKFRKDSSPASVKSLVNHAYEFFAKYEPNLQAEIRQLLAK